MQLQGWSRGGNGAQQGLSSPDPGVQPHAGCGLRTASPWGHIQLSHVWLATAVSKTIEFTRISKLLLEIQEGRPQWVDTPPGNSRVRPDSCCPLGCGMNLLLGSVPRSLLPIPCSPASGCCHPAPLGICICTSGPQGDCGWERLREVTGTRLY